MRYGYYDFLRYYRRNSVVLWLAGIILGFSFLFLYRTAMVSFMVDKVKTEILKLQTFNKSHTQGITSSHSEAVPSRIPKSCFSSDARGCVCYDQYTVVIKDFPEDRCRDVVNGFARF
jgi:hypothetical protein